MLLLNSAFICRRSQVRSVVEKPSTVRTSGINPFDVTVENLSATGFCFFSNVRFPVKTSISVGLAGAGRADAKITWRKGHLHGCVFYLNLTSHQIEAAFSHCSESLPIASIMPDAMNRDEDASVQTTRILRPLRFGLVALISGSSWALLAIALRNLS
ncbi:MAG: hypothetical protein EOO77_01795 [Oxalobacteraceae bacterium]|nr:MAG: hypothetical protein EOO77_01795 [Oxalobacteraceae bacterium]